MAVPRFGSFQAGHPGVDVRVSACNRLVDLDREGVDLALRYAPASVVPPDAIRLFDERIVAVGGPSLALARPREANPLGQLTLLEYDEVSRPWLDWGA